ncbi:hypothetical protein THRCLA_21942 [Thraustotheca clavata]|uniref:START domain-containing protein n=1 Tax=Thraustotheca clavata TaxID=74557 RepID=A0A1V9ZHV4_9STRA|nr:hypothetical protein THRCLA_21942 [Thraustotheca clavata]
MTMTDNNEINFLDDFLEDVNDGRPKLRATTAQQRYRERQRQELRQLHQQVHELSEHLDVLKHIRGMETKQSSYWEKKARMQKLFRQKASKENTRLKEAIEEQIKIATTLKQVLEDNVIHEVFQSGDMVNWKLRRMPSDRFARHECFHAIVDDAYERAETILLERGLFDCVNGHKSFNVGVNANECISIEIQAVKILPCNFMVAAKSFWSHWNDAETHPIKVRMLETFGPDGIYLEQFEMLPGDIPYIRRLAAMKRYVEKDRVVFVMRTILEDPYYPAPPELYVGDHAMTLVLERINDKETWRRLCVIGKIPSEAPPLNPLANTSQHWICDFTLLESKRIMTTIEETLEARDREFQKSNI